jgi:hypothetical protein
MDDRAGRSPFEVLRQGWQRKYLIRDAASAERQ